MSLRTIKIDVLDVDKGRAYINTAGNITAHDMLFAAGLLLVHTAISADRQGKATRIDKLKEIFSEITDSALKEIDFQRDKRTFPHISRGTHSEHFKILGEEGL